MDDNTVTSHVATEGYVYDRYRFAVPLKCKVIEKSVHNDGVLVELLESNNSKWPVGAEIWVHERQVAVHLAPIGKRLPGAAMKEAGRRGLPAVNVAT